MKAKYPKILYKYCCFDEEGHVFDLIRKGKMWFSSARCFNDPFDTSITYNYDGLYDKIAQDWVYSIIECDYPNLSFSEKKKLATEKLNEIRRDPSILLQRMDAIIEMQYNKFGICCFSEIKSNILLWSHYAKNHSGVCVGFSTNLIMDYADRLLSQNELLDLVKVKYAKEYPQHSLIKIELGSEDVSDVEDILYTKSSDWSYEKEYRLIFWGKTNFCINFGFDTISEIVLGCRISAIHRDQILGICSTSENPPQVYQAIKSERQFSLDYERML